VLLANDGIRLMPVDREFRDLVKQSKAASAKAWPKGATPGGR
jgi:hypothetical protein